MDRFALLTAVASFLLIVAGGLVTSTDSGLSVPDWPLSYGRFFPPMVGGIRLEHSHRMIAATVGILTLILAIWVLRKEPRKSVRRLAAVAFLAVLLQGLLGGLTVLMGLPPAVSVAHAVLGPAFFAAIALLATSLSKNWRVQQEESSGRPAWISLAMASALLVQLFLGALLRHAGWNPKVLGAHILGALAVLTFGIALRDRPLKVLLAIQILLGAWTLARGGDAISATAHVAVGALLLARSWILAAALRRSSTLPPTPSPLTPHPFSAYLELAKPRLTGLAVISTLCGFLLAATGPVSLGRMFLTLAGAALIGAGMGALNQVLERKQDAKMKRTQERPIPSGRLSAESALSFGVLVCAAGLFFLSLVHPLAGLLSAFTVGSYLFLYTPLKTRSALCTLVGAIPGAMPPLIGWAAACGQLTLGAWILFGILFLWQLPHFLAIAWVHRDDYKRAGFQMLPVLDEEGYATGRQIILYSLALLPMSLLPSCFGFAGPGYFVGALVSSLLFLGLGIFTAATRSAQAAFRLFVGSIVYLPWLLVTMTLDRVF